MDQRSAMEDLNALAATGHTTTQTELSHKWLTHFGADRVQDLDIGVLEAIAFYVRKGISPPNECPRSTNDTPQSKVAERVRCGSDADLTRGEKK